MHCTLRMQEGRFEFDTGCGNELRIHFSNNQFVGQQQFSANNIHTMSKDSYEN